MSRKMPRVPITAPDWSRSGIRVVEVYVTRPSGQTSFSSTSTRGMPVLMISCSVSSLDFANSGLKKLESDFPTASSGLLSPYQEARVRFTLMKRLEGSLK